MAIIVKEFDPRCEMYLRRAHKAHPAGESLLTFFGPTVGKDADFGKERGRAT
jgi:hypothetical protein